MQDLTYRLWSHLWFATFVVCSQHQLQALSLVCHDCIMAQTLWLDSNFPPFSPSFPAWSSECKGVYKLWFSAGPRRDCCFAEPLQPVHQGQSYAGEHQVQQEALGGRTCQSDILGWPSCVWAWKSLCRSLASLSLSNSVLSHAILPEFLQIFTSPVGFASQQNKKASMASELLTDQWKNQLLVNPSVAFRTGSSIPKTALPENVVVVTLVMFHKLQMTSSGTAI